MKNRLVILIMLGMLQGPAHSATSLNLSAQVDEAEKLLWQGDLSSAGKLFKGLIKRAQNLGQTVEAARIYDNYSWFLQGQNDLNSAVSYANDALQMRLKLLQPTDPQLAESYEHLGELAEAQGTLHDAISNYKRAIEIRKQAGTSQAIPLANTLERLAIVTARSGNPGEAQAIFTEAQADKSEIGAPFQKFANPNGWQTVVYRFAQSAPNCSHEAVAGESLATIDADGLRVQAVVLPAVDFKGMTAFVRVINNAHAPVEFLPEPPALIEITPRVRMAKRLESDTVAAQIEKKGNRTANLIRFFQGDATTPIQSTVMTPGYKTRPGWGYAPYPNGQWGAYPIPSTRVPTQTTTVTTYVPDYEARARAEAKAQAAIQKASDAAALIRDQKLLATTLPPQQMAQGSVLFDATKFKTGVLRVPIGNAVFEFPISN